MNKITGLFFILIAASNIKSESHQELEPDFFLKLNKSTHLMLFKILDMLSLTDRIQKVERLQFLWQTHENMNALAENFFQMFIDIASKIKVEADNKTVNPVEILNKAIDEIAQDDNATVNDKINDKFHTIASHEESIAFISDFTKRFENFTVFEILNKALQEEDYKTKTAKRRKKKVKRRIKKLKVWDAKRRRIGSTAERRSGGREPRFPFMASVFTRGTFSCAGAILANYFVITAASCLHIFYKNYEILEKPNTLTVRAGSAYTNKDGDVISVKKVHFHPDYDPGTWANNLGILRLRNSVKIKWPTTSVMKIKYKREYLTNYKGQFIVVGWGERETRDIEALGFTRMDILDDMKCTDSYTKKFFKPNNFCGTIDEARYTGPCRRDVGSPAVAKDILVGLVSYGPSTCDPHTPMVFTDLGKYTDWIDSIITGISSSKLRTAQKMKQTTKPVNHFSKPVNFQNLETNNTNNPIVPNALKLLAVVLKNILNNEELQESQTTTEVNFISTSFRYLKTPEAKESYNLNKDKEIYSDTTEVQDISNSEYEDMGSSDGIENSHDKTESSYDDSDPSMKGGLSISVETTPKDSGDKLPENFIKVNDTNNNEELKMTTGTLFSSIEHTTNSVQSYELDEKQKALIIKLVQEVMVTYEPVLGRNFTDLTKRSNFKKKTIINKFLDESKLARRDNDNKNKQIKNPEQELFDNSNVSPNYKEINKNVKKIIRYSYNEDTSTLKQEIKFKIKELQIIKDKMERLEHKQRKKKARRRRQILMNND